MDSRMQAELNQLFGKIRKLEPSVIRQAKNDLNEAAKPIVEAAKANAPKSKKAHILRGGKKIQPGNLKRAIRRLALRRAKFTAVVGIKTGGQIDAFYGQFVEKGTRYQTAQRFMERAEQSTRNAALNDAVSRISKRIDSFQKQYFR